MSKKRSKKVVTFAITTSMSCAALRGEVQDVIALYVADLVVGNCALGDHDPDAKLSRRVKVVDEGKR